LQVAGGVQHQLVNQEGKKRTLNCSRGWNNQNGKKGQKGAASYKTGPILVLGEKGENDGNGSYEKEDCSHAEEGKKEGAVDMFACTADINLMYGGEGTELLVLETLQNERGQTKACRKRSRRRGKKGPET